MRFNICLIKPSGYIHSAAFAELAEVVGYGLKDLGYEVGINVNQLFADATNIVIGCHLLPDEAISQLPSSTIVLNTEQIYRDNMEWNHKIFSAARRCRLWDYSKKNIEKLESLGIHGGRFLQIGYHPKLNRLIKRSEQDIDVLFYGSINARREKILEGLESAGLKVEKIFGVYGSVRDQLIERAKVVINMHFYDSKIFEIVRTFYLMANSKAIVSEVSQDTVIDECYRDGVCGVPYDRLIESCCDLVENKAARELYERKAYEVINMLPQSNYLAKLVEDNVG